jgi:hypothetical protein
MERSVRLNFVFNLVQVREVNFSCSRSDFSIYFSEPSEENRETKNDFVLGFLVMMGREDTLLTPINGILFLLGGCVLLLGVTFTDNAFFFIDNGHKSYIRIGQNWNITIPPGRRLY